MKKETNPLSNLSDAELNGQIQELAEERKRRALAAAAAAREARIRANAALLEARPALLGLLQHERTSCSDENPSNGYSTSGRGGYPRCAKCMLMNLSEADLGEVDLELRLRFREDHPNFS